MYKARNFFISFCLTSLHDRKHMLGQINVCSRLLGVDVLAILLNSLLRSSNWSVRNRLTK